MTSPSLPQHYFTINFNHENQKTLELRTEDAKDCDKWVAAIAHARYRPAPPQAGDGAAGVKLCPGPLLAGGAEPLWSPALCQGPLCRAGGCVQTLPVPSRPAQWAPRRALPVPAWRQGMPNSVSGSKAPGRGFIWNCRSGQKEVSPADVSVLRDSGTARVLPWVEQRARRAARSGQVSFVCRRSEKHHPLLHLNESRCS